MDWGLKAIGQSFFDRERVLASVDKATRQVLSKAGAFIRQRAKTSIRKRKASSPPGQPPSSHRGDLRRLIFFAYDARSKSVVVGPALFESRKTNTYLVPQVLEHGGRVVRLVSEPRSARKLSARQKAAFARLMREGRLVRPPAAKVQKQFTYRGNPFMEPAARAELPKFRDLLRGVVK